jgi:hypothetical protein
MSIYIYLLQEREFIKTKEQIYKVGMTRRKNLERFNEYPKGSELLFQMICTNYYNIEHKIINIFKNKFIQRTDIGREYFEGNYINMINIIYSTITNKTHNDNDDDKNDNDDNDDDDDKNDNDADKNDNDDDKNDNDDDKNDNDDNDDDDDKNDNDDDNDDDNDNYNNKYENENNKYENENNKINYNFKFQYFKGGKEFKILRKKISNIFPNYKNDIAFGGTKQYVKIKFVDNNYIIYWINSDILYNYITYKDKIDDDDIFYEKIICSHEMTEYVADDLLYFKWLIQERHILINKIYDLNSYKFINKINKTKTIIAIENYQEFQKEYTLKGCSYCRCPDSCLKSYCIMSNKIRQNFYSNILINYQMYATIATYSELCDNHNIKFHIFNDEFKKLKCFDRFRIDTGINEYNIITIYKINNKYYDYTTFIRKYFPYNIRCDNNNNYYILNCDYEYIGLNTKNIPSDNFTCKSNIYLFKKGNPPWNNKTDYDNFCNNYKKIIKDNNLQECLNPYNILTTILNL